MPTFTNLDLEEPSTVTARVGTVQIVRGTTNEEQEILCLGDPDTSNAIAAVTASAPASTRWALNVRLAGGPSSAADVAVSVQPVAGSTFATRPLQSSAADLQMTATPAAGSTFNVRPLQSSAADLQVTVTPATGSTFIISHGKDDSTSVSGRQASSGDLELISSATTRVKVYAYSLIRNSTVATTLRFLSGSTQEIWRVLLQAPSSAGPTIAGANLAVAMPAHLFRTSSGAALVLNTSDSGSVYSVGVFREST